jgi:uncharacterized protein YaaW (UPF0174 family)
MSNKRKTTKKRRRLKKIAEECIHFFDSEKSKVFYENDGELYLTSSCTVCGKSASQSISAEDLNWWTPADHKKTL